MLTGIRLKEKVTSFGKRMKGIAHPHRLGILYLLAHGPMCTHDIAGNADLPENLIVHHLFVLEHAGWVRKKKQGRTVTYTIQERAFGDFYRLFVDTPFYHLKLMKRLKK